MSNYMKPLCAVKKVKMNNTSIPDAAVKVCRKDKKLIRKLAISQTNNKKYINTLKLKDKKSLRN